MLTVLLAVLEVMLVVCQAVCQVVRADSQVLVDQVLLMTTAQLLRRSTKLFFKNLFSWFVCICNIMPGHNHAMALVSSGAFSHPCG